MSAGTCRGRTAAKSRKFTVATALAHLLARLRVGTDERAEQFQGTLCLFLAEPADEQLQLLPRCHTSSLTTSGAAPSPVGLAEHRLLFGQADHGNRDYPSRGIHRPGTPESPLLGGAGSPCASRDWTLLVSFRQAA
jgi:hypothetical protein